ncbi:hypothetical protein [Candidatus Binatus sp.]|uniref:hypothetical protein n=1 Tax=Candidatus Binatus sp. TaxID=2811406 RepID=UPI003C74496C
MGRAECVCVSGEARPGLHTAATVWLALAACAIEACSSIGTPLHPLAAPQTDRQPAVPAVSEVQTAQESLPSPTDEREKRSQIDSFSDPVLSGALTYYFEESNLPLVGVEVCANDAGDMYVILYGFVATRLRKDDAEEEARQIFGDPYVPIDNRIMIRSDLVATFISPAQGPGASHFVQGETSEIGYLYEAPMMTMDDASE